MGLDPARRFREQPRQVHRGGSSLRRLGFFWARASIGDEVLDLWLETYQISRSFRKRGIVELELP